ncbi:MAG TPA: hypothetical protein VM677_19240 [Actinokineospora sp.]|nr:hypothetical protein [Actinokineospora sp.]
MLLAGIVLAETLIIGLLTAAAAVGVGIVGLKLAASMFGGRFQMLQGVEFPWQAGLAGVIAGLAAAVNNPMMRVSARTMPASSILGVPTALRRANSSIRSPTVASPTLRMPAMPMSSTNAAIARKISRSSRNSDSICLRASTGYVCRLPGSAPRATRRALSVCSMSAAEGFR